MKTVTQLLLVIALLSFASVAAAYTIGTTDVGGLDPLIGYGTLGNSGDQGEVDFVNNKLGLTGTNVFTKADMTKVETDGGAGWGVVDERPSVYSYDFGMYAPSYFLVKIGVGGLDSALGTHFLFSNTNGYGVVDLWQLINSNEASLPRNMNFGRFSHIDTFGAVPVPEPTTFILLGSGLAGLAFYRRKRK